jgi:hypothetical protein
MEISGLLGPAEVYETHADLADALEKVKRPVIKRKRFTQERVAKSAIRSPASVVEHTRTAAGLAQGAPLFVSDDLDYIQ